MTAALLLGVLDPLDHKVFQQVFGDIMTLLIALEFNHTLQYVVAREQSIIQTKVVLLIALLAAGAQVHHPRPARQSSAGPAASASPPSPWSLGVTYWLLRERDERRLLQRGPCT